MGKRGPAQLPRAERFWQRVDRSDAHGCWPWIGAVNTRRGGYGYFYDDDQRLRRAHRIAWELVTGEVLTADVALLHVCDAPLCCRVEHLSRGTQADNMRDMYTKGRSPIGAARSTAKLNDEAVRWARVRLAAGDSMTSVAHDLHVSYGTVRALATGYSWRHVV